MLLAAWLFLGALAVLTTGIALLTSDDSLAIITGILGMLSWGLFAYNALEVEVVDAGTTVTMTMPSVTIISLAFAVVPTLIALTGPVEIVARVRDTTQDEV